MRPLGFAPSALQKRGAFFCGGIHDDERAGESPAKGWAADNPVGRRSRRPA